jgi:bifunctional non-homologous end joining protein LigD
MGLREYYDKRDFTRTPEPRGKEHERQGWSFCVQKHAATRLHYDFRLELDGVLKSWAVPKGPSHDPSDKRLAMQTEDHPLEYGGFEGIIPAGEYGGGTVVLWDRGRWEPLEEPHQAYAKGRLKFRLYGEKLQGAWMLVKTRGRDPRDAEKSWLLFKERDEFARPASEYDVTKERPESVLTGRTLEEIAAERDRVWHSNRPATPKKGVHAAVARALEKKEKKAAAARAVNPAEIPGARKAPLPRFVKPQLATLVDEAPAGDDWLHELKFDGYRILCRLQGGKARLLSRSGKDWTEHFEPVARAAEQVGAGEALLDGEVAVLLADGTTSFNALQNASTTPSGARLTYFLFDLLHLDGYDLTRAPLERRKEALRPLLPPAAAGTLRFSDHVVGSGREFHERACRMKLEGIVSKRRDAPYEAARSRTWLKVKCVHEQEFVIGGFTDPEGSRAGIGALLLGVYDGDRLDFAGKVGTGFTDKSARTLRQSLEAIQRKASPFAAKIPGTARAHWVEPERVAQVAFSEWTSDGKLRHPSFKGLREDKPARQVVRERPREVEDVAPSEPMAPKQPTAKSARKPAKKPAKKAATKASASAKSVPRPLRSAEKPPASVFRRSPGGPETSVAGVRLTNPDRVLYPDQGLTKLDLARYYETIADWILPHVKGRPTTLVRCPEGLAEPCFYQKHTGWWAPEALRRVKIQEKTKVGEYLVVDDLAGLIGLVQIGILEIHTWNALADDVERPDRIVFDLDPDTALPWSRVVEAAHKVRERLTADQLESFVKTTGGKGLHVVVPLAGRPTWDDCSGYAERIATEIAGREPRAYVAEMSKAKRTGKVFIDWLRNVRGSTSVAAYSTRAKRGAPVSVPVGWPELGPRGGPPDFSVKNVPRRLKALDADPWAGYWKARQKLPAS